MSARWGSALVGLATLLVATSLRAQQVPRQPQTQPVQQAPARPAPPPAYAPAYAPAPVPAPAPAPAGPRLDVPALFAPGGSLSPGLPAARARSSGRLFEVLDKEEPVPRVALLFNPALAPLGKWSGRLEIAPLRHHALFVEVSRVRLTVDDVHAEGWEIDVGYHLFVLGNGLAGVYIGPRYGRGFGHTDVAQADVVGYGGDLGFQWVVGPIAFNIGLGAAYAKGVAEPRPGVLDDPSLTPEARDQIPKRVEKSGMIPLATLGLGLAF